MALAGRGIWAGYITTKRYNAYEVSWVFGFVSGSGRAITADLPDANAHTMEAQVTTWGLSHEDDDIANVLSDLVADLAPKNPQRASLEHLMQAIFRPPLSTDFSIGTIENTEPSDFTIGLPAPSSGRAK